MRSSCRKIRDSHGEGHWDVAEVDGDHEDVEFVGEAPADQPVDAGDEHGDDEGTGNSYYRGPRLLIGITM